MCQISKIFLCYNLTMTIILIILMLFNTYTPTVFANNEQLYARVMQENTYLYRSPYNDDSIDNVYFELPKTYFVELISSPNKDFFEARYMDIIGYVKKDCVQAVSSTPKTPYLSGYTFRVFADMSEELRSTPTNNNNNHITSIPHLANNIIYIGSISGESLIEGRTNIWYYCRYIGDKVYDGYVYSDFCDGLANISPNIEELKYIPNPSFSTTTQSDINKNISNNFIGILIGILSIPALIFVFMILKSKQILSDNSHRNSEIKDY